MKFVRIKNQIVSLENVQEIKASEISATQHTSYGKKYYDYSCFIEVKNIHGTTAIIKSPESNNKGDIEKWLNETLTTIERIL